MIRILFLLSVLALLITSCATMSSMWSADHNMRNVEVNMTKQEVISIMGDKYEVVGGADNLEVIGYKTADEGIYKLYFEDGILREWNKEWLNYYRSGNCNTPVRTTTKDNSAMRFHLKAHRNAMLSTSSSDFQKQAINHHMDAHEKMVLGD